MIYAFFAVIVLLAFGGSLMPFFFRNPNKDTKNKPFGVQRHEKFTKDLK